jgi:methionyl-tRNA formyltransferase
VSYLPQRLPEDGAIDWSLTADQIHDFVRALRPPYPGAFSRLGDGRVFIDQVIPMDIDHGRSPGTVVAVLANGGFVIAAGCGALFVSEHRVQPGTADVKPGMKLDSIDFREQLRQIVDRHLAKYPDLPLNGEILAAMKA